MPNQLSAVRYTIHKACAYPMVICWIIGTCVIWAPLTWTFTHGGIFATLLDDWTSIPLLLICYAATSGLGFFIGTFFILWPVLLGCRRLNGAPHKVGDQVLILSGNHSGTVTFIYEIAVGRGGEPLPRIDLGIEAKEKFKDLYNDYCLLRVSSQSTA